MLASNLVILLVVFPMLAAILTTSLRGWTTAQRLVGVASLLACIALSASWLMGLIAAGDTGAMVVTQVGGWPAPFGISVVFDKLSGMLVLAASVVALCCYVNAFYSVGRTVEQDWFHPLFHLLVMGVNFSFLTGDLFNLFVAFEILLLSSYALLCIGGTRPQLAQAYKYVMLNLAGSTVFVLGAGLVYGLMGTLNFADLARMVAESSQPGGAPLPTGFHAVGVVLLFVFALKAAIFPLWFWLPDTYPTAPIPVLAMFGGLLTKVGVYALCRVYPMIFAAPAIRDDGLVMPILAFGAGLTMVVAILAAVAMRTIRRILALTLVSHVGYLIFGLAVMSPASLAGTALYMVQHMVVMAALFLLTGLIERREGTDDLAHTGGLLGRDPWLALLFFIAALSLAGLPPFSGFYGKLLLIREGFAHFGEGYWALSAAALLTSVLTLVAMARIWSLAFWSPEPPEVTARPASHDEPLFAYIGAGALVAVSLAMALGAEGLTRLSLEATRELAAPQSYVDSVLGAGAWPDADRVAAPTPDETPAEAPEDAP